MRSLVMGAFPFLLPSFVSAYYLHPRFLVPYFYLIIHYVTTRALLLELHKVLVAQIEKIR